MPQVKIGAELNHQGPSQQLMEKMYRLTNTLGRERSQIDFH